MFILDAEALRAFTLVAPGVVVTAVGAGLCMAKSRVFYVLVLGGSGWCSIVMWNYVQRVLEVSEVTGAVRVMMLALPVIFFVMLNAGVLASITGKGEADEGEVE